MDQSETSETEGTSVIQNSDYTCDYCQKQFRNRAGLRQHVKIHTGQKDYHCNLCHYSSANKTHLQVHIRRHLKERPFKCEELNCGVTFVTSWDLKDHQIVHNKENKQFACSICPFKTYAKSYLNGHHKRMHTEPKPTANNFCNLCDYSTFDKKSLQIHIRRHLNEKPFQCPEPNCKAAFVDSSSMKIHQLTHNKNDKRFPCLLCPFKTHRKHLLTQHGKRIHSHSRPFKCPHENCEYSAKMKNCLNRHLRIHCEGQVCCPHFGCEFQTKTSAYLKIHMKIHSNEEKRHKCRLCEYSSHRGDHMILHVRRHTGETPFPCTLCSYKSRSKSNLNQHMSTQH